MLKKFWRYLCGCTKCGNTGFITSHGPAVPFDRIQDPALKAWVLAWGGEVVETVKVPCPNCKD